MKAGNTVEWTDLKKKPEKPKKKGSKKKKSNFSRCLCPNKKRKNLEQHSIKCKKLRYHSFRSAKVKYSRQKRLRML